MATVEHCLYSFESLIAELEHRPSLSLVDTQKSYAAYLDALAAAAAAAEPPSSTAKKLPALARLASSGSPASGSSSSSSTTSLASASTAAATSISSTASSAPPQRITDPNARYPLFVTWDKRSSSDDDDDDEAAEWHLRGCIGTFDDSAPLAPCLAEYALTAALRDTRFPRPVGLREVPRLRVAVTLLTDFEPAAGPDDWVLGTHGLRLSFTWRGRRYGSTYLPSVAPEQGWDKEQTMVSLMRKAGWDGPKSEWRKVVEASGMEIVRYRGDKEEVEYAEYKAWRDWVSENWNEAKQ